jgi:hypothetical protein
MLQATFTSESYHPATMCVMDDVRLDNPNIMGSLPDSDITPAKG